MSVVQGDKYANDAKWGGATGGKHAQGLHGNTGIGRQKVTTGFPAKSLMGLPWRFAAGCIDGRAGAPLILRAEVVWYKTNAMPESVTDRVRRDHEQVFHFTRQGDYYADLTEVREPSAPDRERRYGTGRHTATDYRSDRDHGASNADGRLPGSVWRIPTEPLVLSEAVREHYGLPEHYAAFPQELPRRIILGWCPPVGLVVDPFGGTGTTAGVAHALGRRGVSFDLSHDYGRLARWFERDGRRFAKAASRTDRDRQGALL